eukprot:COSAG01_NODE_53476_length_339_cov_0.520833_1_plen_69_part_10
MMLGAGAWKMKTDAYLYYAMNGWGQYSRGLPWSWEGVSPELDVSYLRWENATYDGEGEFIYPGAPSSRY